MAQLDDIFVQQVECQRKDLLAGALRSSDEIRKSRIPNLLFDGQLVFRQQRLALALRGPVLEFHKRVLGVEDRRSRRGIAQCRPGETDLLLLLEDRSCPLGGGRWSFEYLHPDMRHIDDRGEAGDRAPCPGRQCRVHRKPVVLAAYSEHVVADLEAILLALLAAIAKFSEACGPSGCATFSISRQSRVV